jgi:ketosteroid isomerase-like protein
MRVFLAGATGAIGSPAKVEQLRRLGAEPVVVNGLDHTAVIESDRLPDARLARRGRRLPPPRRVIEMTPLNPFDLTRRKPMGDLQAIADRVEIQALWGEFTDAEMMDDYDRFASLFTQDGVWRVPAVNAEFAGREEIRAGIQQLKEGLWDYLVQTTHPGTIQLDGDTASGRAYVLSFGRFRDGGSHLNYSVYHDRYRRTPDGWKFAERVDEVLYLDTTPLAGSAPHAVLGSERES